MARLKQKSQCQPGRKCYVFWPYDNFPYLLGAMGELKPDGGIHIPSYQMTLWGDIQRHVIYDLKVGKAFKEELDRARASRHRVIEEVELGFANQIKSLRLAIVRQSKQESK